MAESVSKKPGEARCPGITVQDLLAQDSRAVPDYLTTQSYEFLGDADIPFGRYTDQSFHDQEIEKLWTRTWQWACREEHIPDSGDYYVYDIGPYSVIVAHTESGEIKAYRNACMHRGWVKTEMAGAVADIEPDESARGVRAVITQMTLADSGKFLTWTGDVHEW